MIYTFEVLQDRTRIDSGSIGVPDGCDPAAAGYDAMVEFAESRSMTPGELDGLTLVARPVGEPGEVVVHGSEWRQ